MSSHTCEQCGGLTGVHAHKVANVMQTTGQRIFVCQGHPKPDPRDTQFAGFADALLEEIDKIIDEHSDSIPWGSGIVGLMKSIEKSKDLEEAIRKHVAHRAYDLALHTLKGFDLSDLETCDRREDLLDMIPDLTELPKEVME